MERKKIINIFGKKVTVEYPNVGQLIDIESTKYALTRDRYPAMVASKTLASVAALDLTDAIAFFTVMTPHILKTVNNGDPLTSLSPDESKGIVDVYRKEIAPWVRGIVEGLYSIGKDDAKEGDGDAGK